LIDLYIYVRNIEPSEYRPITVTNVLFVDNTINCGHCRWPAMYFVKTHTLCTSVQQFSNTSSTPALARRDSCYVGRSLLDASDAHRWQVVH